MFDSIFINGSSVGVTMLMMGFTVVFGFIAALLCSIKARSSKGFFVTAALLPAITATTFYFLNVTIKTDSASAIASIATVMVGMGLLRFRSALCKAEEMLILFLSLAIGVMSGLGYLAYAAVVALGFPLVYICLSCLGVFGNKRFASEKLLKITIPESLEYSGVFDNVFAHYLKDSELVGVKTTGMGSMFRLSYRIVMKDSREEKEMIDELRTKNGNLEISVLPYVEDARML